MKLNQVFKVLSLAVVLALTAHTVSAQAPEGGDRPRRTRDGQNDNQPGGPGRGRGMFDPAQRLERIQEAMEIKEEAEWKAIEPLVAKVMDAQRELLMGRFARGGRGGGAGQSNANLELEALQKAIDAKASNAEVKAAVAKVVAARKAKEAALEKAQAALRKVLTPRQEAVAILNNVL